MSRRIVAIAALLTVMVIWGSTFVVTKSAIAELSPVALAFVRVSLGALVMLPFAVRRWSAAGFALPWQRLWAMALLGAALYYLVFNWSLALTSASQGALVQSSTPAVTALLAALWLNERASGLRALGIALSIVGMLIVFAEGARERPGAPAPMLGNALMFAAVVCLSGYTALARRLAQYDSAVVTACVMGLAALMLLPFAAWEALSAGLGQVGYAAWLDAAYLGVVATGIAYLFYNYALRHMAASQVGVFTNLIPIVGVLSGVIAFGEPLSWQAILGGLVVMAGVALTIRS